jgi:putative RNA 2'-phosphotransferase
MDLVSLSKTISHALRHEPEKYGLVLKENGWVDIEALILGIRASSSEFSEIEWQHIEKAISSSGKKRHEINGNEIRALYGHSKKLENDLEPVKPPKTLYHGTTVANGSNIGAEGIKKMDRQYVHLSSTVEEAVIVAKRRKEEITILEVAAERAFNEGIVFFNSGNVWLCKYVPAVYVQSINKFKG